MEELKQQNEIVSAKTEKNPNINKVGSVKAKVLKYLPFWVIMLPGLVYLLINNILPLYGMTIAFREIDFSVGILNSPLNGFDNFKYIFGSKLIWPLLGRTVAYNLCFMVLDILIPVTIAVLLFTVKNKVSRKVFQTCILFPNVISYVIVSFIVFGLLSNDGMLNNLLFDTPIDFYAKPEYWPVILTFVHIWKGVGFGMVVYFATLMGIDPSLYEAASLDGASWMQKTIHITLPSLRKMIVTMFILSLGGIVRSDFGLFYQVTMNQGALYDTTQTLDVFVYNALKVYPDLTSSSAVGVFQSVVGFLLVVGANLIVRKIDKESAMF